MKLFFVSLGCDKNTVDSENMIGLLTQRGFEMTDLEEDADVIIVNTCCFIDDAKQESIDTILDMAQYRKDGKCKALIVAGCLAQRYKEEIVKEIPEVDAVLGTMSYDKVAQAVDEALRGAGYEAFDDISRSSIPAGKRVLTTGGHYAYLKIAEGCNKHCTYCIIPSVRGNYRSRAKEEILEEARGLAEAGVVEVILVAQETTLYGSDLYGKKCLHELIHELAQIEGFKWIRVLYCYPEEIYPELIDCMRDEPKFVHYLDLPIQHANDDILKRMGRRTNQADLRRIIGDLRREVPDIMLRTTLITGFPGETQEQHEDVCRFINEMEFNRLGVFTYSKEDDTPAARMDGQIDEETKNARRDELMELQQEISTDLNETFIGRELEVMVEGKLTGEDVYVCRTYGDTPGVDGYLFLNTTQSLMSGDFVKVKVTGSDEYDLTGELLS